MKIALFSDVHANLPALEAVLEDIDRQHVDAIYCLGDLVGYNVWPNEVIDLIRQRRIPTIAGNYDFGIGRSSDDCGCAYKNETEKAMGAHSIAYTNSSIQTEARQYLRTLPSHIQLEFKLNIETHKLLLVHGSPRKINEYLLEDRDEKSLLRILENAGADLLCFGHTHRPYHRKLPYMLHGQLAYRHAINLGAVGKPKDGDPRACYALLTIDQYTTLKDPESLTVEFVRVPYPIQIAVAAIQASPLPDDYAEMLRRAF
jgi:putative phosphoesterase